MKIPELLAPAGDYQTLIAVCNAGADAVYAAGNLYGARAYAPNFSEEELLSGMEYLHLHGKKLYLTVNTLLKDREIDSLYAYLLPLYQEGLDAVIVQDAGVFTYLRDQFPHLPVHISTQAAVMGEDGLRFFAELGAKRVVLPRELSLEEISALKEKSPVELEIFAHGALCYCYSGLCFYSSLIGGRSGNRGKCAQPCRLECTIGGRKRDWLSLKDLSALPVLENICQAGVDSIKIEGRMKQAAYAAGVTGIYRKYLDMLQDSRYPGRPAAEDLLALEQLYRRRGFDTGYLYRHNGPEMLSDSPRKTVETQNPDLTDLTEHKRPVQLTGRFYKGQPAALQVTNGRGTDITVYGAVCAPAKNQPLSISQIREKLQKTGDFPYRADSVEIEADHDIFMPVSALNALRRDALQQFRAAEKKPYFRAAPEKKDIPSCEELSARKESLNPRLTASVLSVAQAEALLVCPQITRIYLPLDLFLQDRTQADRLCASIRKQQKEVFCALPAVFRSPLRSKLQTLYPVLDKVFDGFLVKNTDELMFLHDFHPEKPCVADFTVYCMNRASLGLFREYCSQLTAPIELNRHELKQMDLSASELVVYGRYPMMYTANCLLKNTDRCRKNGGMLSFRDRKNMELYAKADCLACYNTIYNAKILSLSDRTGQLQELHAASYRLMFTAEAPAELPAVLDAFAKGTAIPKNPQDYTRGHFDRGVE